MIKEQCSCGADIHVDMPNDKHGTQEALVAADWRENHKHSPKINYLPTYPQPPFTPTWASGAAGPGGNPNLYTTINIPEPPEPVAKPGTVA